ncbi:MAG: porin [Pseudomonadota bacterium]
MKNVLFASTALVAVAAAGSAFADGHGGGVKIGVSSDIGVVYTDNGDNSSVHLLEDFDVSIEASTTTDNGLTISSEASGENAGDHIIKVAGAFGSVQLGDDDNAFDAAMIGIAAGGVEPSADIVDDSGIAAGVPVDDPADYDRADSGISGYELLYTSPDLGGGNIFLSVAADSQNGEDGIGGGAQFSFGPASVGAAVEAFGEDDLLYGLSGKVATGPVTIIAAMNAGEVGGADVLIVEGSVEFDTGAGTIGALVSADLEQDDYDDIDYGAFFKMPIGGGATFNIAAGADTVSDDTTITSVGTSISVSF